MIKINLLKFVFYVLLITITVILLGTYAFYRTYLKKFSALGNIFIIVAFEMFSTQIKYLNNKINLRLKSKNKLINIIYNYYNKSIQITFSLQYSGRY